MDKDRPVPTAREILTQPQLEQTARLSGPVSSSPSVSWKVRGTGSYVPLDEERRGCYNWYSHCTQSTLIVCHAGPPPKQRPPNGLDFWIQRLMLLNVFSICWCFGIFCNLCVRPRISRCIFNLISVCVHAWWEMGKTSLFFKNKGCPANTSVHLAYTFLQQWLKCCLIGNTKNVVQVPRENFVMGIICGLFYLSNDCVPQIFFLGRKVWCLNCQTWRRFLIQQKLCICWRAQRCNDH